MGAVESTELFLKKIKNESTPEEFGGVYVVLGSKDWVVFLNGKGRK